MGLPVRTSNPVQMEDDEVLVEDVDNDEAEEDMDKEAGVHQRLQDAFDADPPELQLQPGTAPFFVFCC